MPRRTRKRCVGKWEQIEQQAREDELRELERELHGEQRRGREPKPKPKRWGRGQRSGTELDAPEDVGNSTDNGTGNMSRDG